MKNRTLFFLTALVLLGMFTLLALNINSILTGVPKNQTYLKYNDVEGMAASHKNILYTLNFKQQNRLIDIFNRSVRVFEDQIGEGTKPEVEKIIVTLFGQKAPVEITLIRLLSDSGNLIFSAPQWDADSYFMELSRGEMQSLLSQTYD